MMVAGTLTDFALVVADVIVTDAFLKGTLLAALTWLVSGALLRARVGVQRGLWVTGAAALLVLPLVTRTLSLGAFPVVEFPQVLFNATPLDALGWAGAGAVPTAAGGTGAAGASAGLPIAVWLAGLWAVGVLALAGRFLVQYRSVRAIAARALPARDRRCRRRLRALDRERHVRRPVRIAYSAEIATPATFGWWRPVVLLPAASRHWSEAKLTAVLDHELAHVRSGDYLVLALLESVRALFWMNPFVWLLVREARRQQELAADAAVLRRGVGPRRYARYILEIARSQRRPNLVAAVPMIRRSALGKRIRAVLEADRPAPAPRRPMLVGALLVVCCAVGLATVDLWSCSADAGESSVATTTPDPAPYGAFTG